MGKELRLDVLSLVDVDPQPSTVMYPVYSRRTGGIHRDPRLAKFVTFIRTEGHDGPRNFYMGQSECSHWIRIQILSFRKIRFRSLVLPMFRHQTAKTQHTAIQVPISRCHVRQIFNIRSSHRKCSFPLPGEIRELCQKGSRGAYHRSKLKRNDRLLLLAKSFDSQLYYVSGAKIDLRLLT